MLRQEKSRAKTEASSWRIVAKALRPWAWLVRKVEFPEEEDVLSLMDDEEMKMWMPFLPVATKVRF